MQSGKERGAKRPPSHMVYMDDETWDRIVDVAVRSKPRRTASDLIREMVDTELPKLEQRNGVPR